MRLCRDFKIPTDWMLDNGILSKVDFDILFERIVDAFVHHISNLMPILQIKFGSVKLAKMYMTRVAMELQSKAAAAEKDPAMDYMLLQGSEIRFQSSSGW
ncbi:hypothetical protein C1H46_027809 [Malus baccata]|uniref:Uncharacterized protein n=1 Tax=Malus baccata TaxID=106549 RepID=A0A540LJP7_MALBA|nr:hypothetical protein C1H46_027809 [Malus baccata]